MNPAFNFLIVGVLFLMPQHQAVAQQSSISDPIYQGPIYTPPVYSEPVYAPPIYSAPVYSAPVYSEPLYSPPISSQPIYLGPLEPQPIPSGTSDPMPSQSQLVPFTGRVVFNNMEGGFYGVVADNGQRYTGTIPEELKQDGMRVKGTLRPRSNQMTTTMWGTFADFVEMSAQ